MRSNVFHRRIELPFKLIHSPLKRAIQEPFSLDVYEVVDQRLLHLIDSCGAYIQSAECFTIPPRGFVNIHLDDGLLSNRTKLNIFLGTGLMKWFQPLPAFKNKKTELTDVGGQYTSFTEDEVELVHENKMSGEYIINPGIPHSFKNSLYDCWVVSLTLFDKTTQDFLLFEDAINSFSKYIKTE